ncbi:TetR/AcrR family transcriptional regulator [Spongiibacter sp. KMU-166]|uniref:TetR/AcrR family transcriptional regulator n=1 Tax=Spongiibacter thalassae TaxID=2721624 RepID=A0ABX1GCB2_9GAMM|nr:TetR/AcrR family transcriptional regulator [Spongiibacter thalassae]NKI16147.1 TetR/AcrR family transcriptional regulator [Spongiibacter thalassae]
MPASTKRARLDSRENIIEKIMAYIRDHDIEKCSMDDFASAAGISRISLYRLFGNRNALIDALVSHRSKQFNTLMATRLRDYHNIDDALVYYCTAAAKLAAKDGTIAYFIESQYVYRAVFGDTMSSIRGHIERAWLPVIEDHFDMDSSCFRKNSAEITEWIVINQATLARLYIDSGCSLDKLKQLVEDFILPGLRSKLGLPVD